MKSGNQRPYWAGFLTGAGLVILFVYFMRGYLVTLSPDYYPLIGIAGLVFVLLGAYLHSPLR